jgi:Tol biopolymer transport system component
MPAWAQDGQSIVFVSDQGAFSNIMQMGVDGSIVTSLTNSHRIKLFPDYDHDGKLYFVRRGLSDVPVIEVVRLEQDGSETAVHSEPGGLCGPTGLSVHSETQIALSLNCGRGSYVFLVNGQTKTSTGLMETYGEPGYCANTATWADQGQRLVVVTAMECSGRQNSNIALLDLGDPAPKLQTVYTSERIGNVVLSQDAQILLFEHWAEDAEPVVGLGVWLLDLPGSALEPQLLAENGASPAWRPKR